jgi:polysaccharide pyruvyl transferase WcaK-like protein
MRILLGGIPLGCNNIGDEAILAGVVRMLRATMPDVELTVATADPGTAALLGVEVVPPYGFEGVAAAGLAAEAERHDAYVWCGATGLSDYPNAALDLLEAAQGAGTATFVWGVGMDDELNPSYFLARGWRLRVLGPMGLTGWYERRLKARLGRRLGRVLSRCRGVWLRDPESAAMLARCGWGGAHLAADSAILLADGMAPERGNPPRRVGLCISRQRRVSDLDGVRRLVDAIRAEGGEVLGIPMNSKTDRRLLEGLGVGCIAGDTPEAVMAAAADCAVVVSSRLHLLILAANAGAPGIGIVRGSKIANWLANFAEAPAGTVADCDWDAVARQALAAMRGEGREKWGAVRKAAYERLRARFEAARKEFAEALRR